MAALAAGASAGPRDPWSDTRASAADRAALQDILIQRADSLRGALAAAPEDLALAARLAAVEAHLAALPAHTDAEIAQPAAGFVASISPD